MKKFILLSLLIGIVFLAWNRNRLYLRDPIAGVTRDGVKEQGAQVFINYPNDILIENDSAPMYVMLVQHGQHVGVPAALKCVHFVVCLADADVATLVVAQPAKVQSMSGKQVIFSDAAGRESVVTLH